MYSGAAGLSICEKEQPGTVFVPRLLFLYVVRARLRCMRRGLVPEKRWLAQDCLVKPISSWVRRAAV